MPLSPRRWSVRRRIIVGLVVAVALGVLYLGLAGVQAWLAWRNIERVAFDSGAARTALESLPSSPTSVIQDPAPPLLQGEFESFLAIGSDERVDKQYQQKSFADSVVLYLVPSDGDSMLVSLPRDLLVTNRCYRSPAKLNELFAGCADIANGPELVAIAVEDLTGIAVDHFGVVGFGGLIKAVDELGGIEVCTEYALRDIEGDLLPAGCSRADGRVALRYVRSRSTLEFVDGDWRIQEGVSDLTRAERQQDVLFAMLHEAKSVKTPDALADLIGSLQDAIVLDDRLSLRDAIDLAWDLRGTPTDRIRRLILPVESVVTEDGQFAYRATTPFLDVIAQG